MIFCRWLGSRCILLFVFHIQLVHSLIDFCNSDPRLNITNYNCAASASESSRKVLIYQPYLNHHPYHALLEGLWPISYYLNNCIESSDRVTLAIPYEHLSEEECKQSNSTSIWQQCALASIVSNIPGKSITTVHLESNDCYVKRIYMNVVPSHEIGIGLGRIPRHYRDLSWFGRQCIGNERNECMHSKNVTHLENTQLVKIPDVYKYSTLNFIRNSFHKTLNIKKPVRTEDDEDEIKVLVYDRTDTRRRQWSNANDFLGMVNEDSRLNIKYITHMPNSFHDQGKLYAWADILISPHGGSMINTFFMHQDSDIFEIWSKCNHNVSSVRFVPKTWTGWHAHFLGHHLTYIQCHAKSLPYKNNSELFEGHGPEVEEPHKSNPLEILHYLEFAIQRQTLKLNHLRAMAVQGDTSDKPPLLSTNRYELKQSFVKWINMSIFFSALSAILLSYLVISFPLKWTYTRKIKSKQFVFV